MKDFVIIIVGVLLLAVVWGGWVAYDTLRSEREPGEGVFCTADVQQCEDGSYVGRIAPDCRFAACPGN